MRKSPARVLACAFALCSAVGMAAPTLMSAQDWLSQVPALPATAEAAYAQWNDVSGVLSPSAAAEKVSKGLEARARLLSREVEQPHGSAGPVSAHDRALADTIVAFPDTSAVAQKVRTAQSEQASVLQKWHAELNSLEQRRVQARGALPACRNGAGTPSQASIRDVEQAFAEEKTEIAVRYLADFQPRLERLLADVSPQIAHGDSLFSAWSKLGNPVKKAQLTPTVRFDELTALADVGLIQAYIQEVSKLAARSIAERNAMQRVYADAKGC